MHSGVTNCMLCRDLLGVEVLVVGLSLAKSHLLTQLDTHCSTDCQSSIRDAFPSSSANTQRNKMKLKGKDIKPQRLQATCQPSKCMHFQHIFSSSSSNLRSRKQKGDWCNNQEDKISNQKHAFSKMFLNIVIYKHANYFFNPF